MIRRTGFGKFNNNKGSTMVETLVSFVVVAAVLAALYAIVSFSTRLWMNSVDAFSVQQSFTDEVSRINYNPSLVEKTSYEPGLPEEPEEDVKYANFALILKGEDEDSEYVIFMDKMGADGYVSIDPSVKDENIAAPKTITFKYESESEEGD